MNALLKVDHLSFRHPKNSYWLLRDLNLTVMPGELVIIYGAAGSGKTTLAELLTGFVKPNQGWVERTKAWGLVPQEFDLYRDLTVSENLDFIKMINHNQTTTILSLNQYGLNGWEETRAANLPSALQKMLQLAATSGKKFDLIILDEPTAGLDRNLREVFWESILGFKTAGKGILILTSNEADLKYADRVYELQEGVLYDPDGLPGKPSGIEPETRRAD